MAKEVQIETRELPAVVVRKWRGLPPEARKLVRIMAELQAECDGEDVAAPHTPGVPQSGGEYMSPAELLVCLRACCRMALHARWTTGCEVVLVDQDGHRVKLGLDTAGV